MDIKGAFDFVYIPTLISCLASYTLSHLQFRLSLFLDIFIILRFSDRLSYRGQPQDSCLSPLLFNVNITPIYYYLISPNTHYIFYANAIMIFSTHTGSYRHSFYVTFLILLSLTTFFYYHPPKKQNLY